MFQSLNRIRASCSFDNESRGVEDGRERVSIPTGLQWPSQHEVVRLIECILERFNPLRASSAIPTGSSALTAELPEMFRRIGDRRGRVVH